MQTVDNAATLTKSECRWEFIKAGGTKISDMFVKRDTGRRQFGVIYVCRSTPSYRLSETKSNNTALHFYQVMKISINKRQAGCIFVC